MSDGRDLSNFEKPAARTREQPTRIPPCFKCHNTRPAFGGRTEATSVTFNPVILCLGCSE